MERLPTSGLGHTGAPARSPYFRASDLPTFELEPKSEAYIEPSRQARPRPAATYALTRSPLPTFDSHALRQRIRQIAPQTLGELEENIQCPNWTAETVRGFPRYQWTIASLPVTEQAKITAVAERITSASIRSGCQAIRTVFLVGHADRDVQRGRAFEFKIGGDRALRVKAALIESIGNPAVTRDIRWIVVPAGSTQMEIARPRTESERQRNRKVQIFASVLQDGLETQVDFVWRYIQETALARATDASRTVNGSNFARVVRSRYLGPYLAARRTDTAAQAIDRIGQQMRNKPPEIVCKVPDIWERAAPLFNDPVPERLRTLIQKIPGLSRWLPNIGAATEILRVNPNRKQLSFIDVPFLLGEHTIDWFNCKQTERMGIDRRADPDLQFQNSKNESQLMHWATGVRYSHINPETLRDFFLGYELWHLEYFDVFGPDPINDLIAEDAGRYLGQQIRALAVNAANYIPVLDEGFRQARAWVGALLRLRRSQRSVSGDWMSLDEQIKSENPLSAWKWWSNETPPTDSKHYPFPAPSIRQQLGRADPLPKVLTSDIVARYIEVYMLLFEADLWERSRGPIQISYVQRSMARGELNKLFRALARLEEASGQINVGRRLKRTPWQRHAGAQQAELDGALRDCTPCIVGHKLCHASIVPDDGSCSNLWDDWYDCRC